MNDRSVLANHGQAAKDVANVVILAALIHHHPNREAVLNTLRQAHLHIPNALGEGVLSPEAAAQVQTIFQAYVGMVREAERTLPA